LKWLLYITSNGPASRQKLQDILVQTNGFTCVPKKENHEPQYQTLKRRYQYFNVHCS
jgi:hypothetical protein